MNNILVLYLLIALFLEHTDSIFPQELFEYEESGQPHPKGKKFSMSAYVFVWEALENVSWFRT